MSDLVRALAFAYRRKGADALAPKDLRMVLAFDLNWFAPADAKRIVERALETGLVAADGELLRPSFDVARVDVPLNFHPTIAILDEPIPDVPRAASAAAAKAGPVDADAVDREARDERARRENLVLLEVARLVVARRRGEDVRERAAALEAALLNQRATRP